MMMHNYGVIFWDEQTDREVFVYFQALDWFAAEEMLLNVDLNFNGYIAGDVFHFNPNEFEYDFDSVLSLDEAVELGEIK